MNATDERAGLMRAILEAPADDTPRLVYADWLTENGEEARAEFIRVQVELATRPPAPHCHAKTCPLYGLYRTTVKRYFENQSCRKCRPRWLTCRENELWEVVRDDFGPDYAVTIRRGKFDNSDHRSLIERGFISAIKCPAATFAAHGPALLANDPVERIDLPFVRVEIALLSPVRKWRAVYYEAGASTWHTCNEWPTRAEMVAGVLRDVRDLEAELA